MTATALFKQTFGHPPKAFASAPARANLMGEHTDYNNGYVLPTPLPWTTTVAISKRTDSTDESQMISALFEGVETITHPFTKQNNWTDYVAGCMDVLAKEGFDIPPVNIAISGDIPQGAGVSSSAALEVATIRALRELLGLKLGNQRLSLLAQRCENVFVGMPCGIMDQMSSSLGKPGYAMLLDTQDLAMTHVALPDDHAVMLVDCGVPHKLTDGGYATRRNECEQAAAMLGVTSLRKISLEQMQTFMALDEPYNTRVRHVVTENNRVMDGFSALQNGDIGAFGQMMVQSHNSQRDDYAVSIPEIDRLVQAAMSAGATGARLTGGGFGGSIVALVKKDHCQTWLASVMAQCPQARPLSTQQATRSGV